MESGIITEWLLKVGDKFEAGTAVCLVSTDKAIVSYDTTEDGYIAKILIGSDTDLKVRESAFHFIAHIKHNKRNDNCLFVVISYLRRYVMSVMVIFEIDSLCSFDTIHHLVRPVLSSYPVQYWNITLCDVM